MIKRTQVRHTPEEALRVLTGLLSEDVMASMLESLGEVPVPDDFDVVRAEHGDYWVEVTVDPDTPRLTDEFRYLDDRRSSLRIVDDDGTVYARRDWVEA